MSKKSTEKDSGTKLPPAFKGWVTKQVEVEACREPYVRTEIPTIPMHDLDTLLREAGAKAIECFSRRLESLVEEPTQPELPAA